MKSRPVAYATLIGYIATMWIANIVTTHYGMVDVGFGYMATAGTFAAGFALLMRDVVQDALGRGWVMAGIAAGAALSFTTSPALAGASATAFLIGELCDMGVYTPLRKRGWGLAVIASGLIGGLADTLVFLHMAGFPVTWHSLAGQFLGKIVWATLIPLAVIATVRECST